MEDRASKTAVDVLAARAINTIAPKHRRILSDPFAVHHLPLLWLIPKIFFRLGKHLPLTFYISDLCSEFVGIGGATMVALRHRYIDDRLIEAHKQGIRQVVILGAGYDSRACRMNLDGASYVEVDHPHTQKNKMKNLLKQHRTLPGGMTLIPVDFRDDWVSVLAASGAIKNEPAFVIWEGVTYYLPDEAIRYTLAGIRKIAPKGSRLIFDHYPKEIANPKTKDRYMRKTQVYGLNRGEPFLWGSDRDDLVRLLEEHGYADIDITTMKEFALKLKTAEGLRFRVKDIYDYMHIAEARI